MEEKNFFKTKEGGLTIAFLVILVAFVIIMVGLSANSQGICGVGFALIVGAMLYSPLRTRLLKKK